MATAPYVVALACTLGLLLALGFTGLLMRAVRRASLAKTKRRTPSEGNPGKKE